MNPTQKNIQAVYEIRVKGELDLSWEAFFKDMTIAPDHLGEQTPPTTTLVVPVIDQAYLRGLLCKLWDLNLTLVSIRRLAPDFLEEKRND